MSCSKITCYKSLDLFKLKVEIRKKIYWIEIENIMPKEPVSAKNRALEYAIFKGCQMACCEQTTCPACCDHTKCKEGPKIWPNIAILKECIAALFNISIFEFKEKDAKDKKINRNDYMLYIGLKDPDALGLSEESANAKNQYYVQPYTELNPSVGMPPFFEIIDLTLCPKMIIGFTLENENNDDKTRKINISIVYKSETEKEPV